MADFSVLIPHKDNQKNDKALGLLVRILYRFHQDCQFTLIIDNTTPLDPYIAYNQMAAQAQTEWVLMLNSDTYPGMWWETPLFLNHEQNPDTIYVPQLVECGAIGVAEPNIQVNFGMTPQALEEHLDKWLYWENDAKLEDRRKPGHWYMPCLIHRETFLDMGGFPTDKPFMHAPNDIIFFEKWLESGRQIQKVNSYWYHLQNWSQDAEQTKAVRYE